MLFEDLCCEERQRGEDNKENMMKVSGRKEGGCALARGEVYINPRPFTGGRSCKCTSAIRGAKASEKPIRLLSPAHFNKIIVMSRQCCL